MWYVYSANERRHLCRVDERPPTTRCVPSTGAGSFHRQTRAGKSSLLRSSLAQARHSRRRGFLESRDLSDEALIQGAFMRAYLPALGRRTESREAGRIA
jgi:hypothetical protein